MPSVLGVNLAVSSYDQLVEKCINWSRANEPRTVFFATVHMLMEAHDSARFRSGLNAADMVNTDGVPLVWALRALGHKDARRVYGPDATEVLLRAAQETGIPIGLYGGTEETLAKLVSEAEKHYPGIQIAFKMSPPFRKLSDDEDNEIVRQISNSGARWLFVGLGCPKQENWIFNHRDRLPVVMLGVGAAFDFIAGSKAQAPRWMMRNGLEWLFRLVCEPRRLAGRYLKHNPRFVFLFLRQWMTRDMARAS